MNFFLVILIFDGSNLGKDICKTIFVILEVQFHHEGGLSGSRYLELFFSARPIFSPYQKSASTEAPFNLFWTLTVILTIFAFWKNYEKKFGTKFGSLPSQRVQNFLLGRFIERETRVYFWPFFNIQKPYRPSCPIMQWGRRTSGAQPPSCPALCSKCRPKAKIVTQESPQAAWNCWSWLGSSGCLSLSSAYAPKTAPLPPPSITNSVSKPKCSLQNWLLQMVAKAAICALFQQVNTAETLV